VVQKSVPKGISSRSPTGQASLGGPFCSRSHHTGSTLGFGFAMDAATLSTSTVSRNPREIQISKKLDSSPSANQISRCQQPMLSLKVVRYGEQTPKTQLGRRIAGWSSFRVWPWSGLVCRADAGDRSGSLEFFLLSDWQQYASRLSLSRRAPAVLGLAKQGSRKAAKPVHERVWDETRTVPSQRHKIGGR